MLSTQLAQRAAENNPIRVGVIGSGKFGAGLVAQIAQMRGMEVAAIADISADRAANAYQLAGGVPRDRAGGLARLLQEARGQAVRELRRGGRGGPLLRLDRWACQADR